MEKCRHFFVKNAYWCVALLLFTGIAGLVMGVCAARQTTYPIVCLGDSIIGNVRDDTSIPAYIAKETGLSTYNGGFGGTTASGASDGTRAAVPDNVISLSALADAICYENFNVQSGSINRCATMEHFAATIADFQRIKWSEVEILIIEHGVNDYLTGVELDNPDDPYDRTTYGGALRYTLKQFQTIRPDLRIILCTPTYCWFYAEEVSCQQKDCGGGYLEDYVNKELEIAEEFDVEILDNFHDSGIGGSFANWSDYTEDGLHLNETGRKLIAQRIAAVILQDEN